MNLTELKKTSSLWAELESQRRFLASVQEPAFARSVRLQREVRERFLRELPKPVGVQSPIDRYKTGTFDLLTGPGSITFDPPAVQSLLAHHKSITRTFDLGVASSLLDMHGSKSLTSFLPEINGSVSFLHSDIIRISGAAGRDGLKLRHDLFQGAAEQLAGNGVGARHGQGACRLL